MSRVICLIEGDGIGHEVIPAGRRLLEATGLGWSFVARLSIGLGMIGLWAIWAWV